MRPGERERGVALVVVLLLLAVMSILVAEFAYAVRIQAALLGNFEARVQARSAARAGQSVAAAILLRTKPDEPNYFNNPMTGIMLFRYQCVTSGNPDSFLAVVGGADFRSLTAEERAQASAPVMLSGGTAGQEGCGRWSLGLPYQLGDANLDIEISDEQARLNLNAMVTAKVSQAAEGVAEMEYSQNRPYFCAVYELIRLQALVRRIEITDSDIFEITSAILDYLDYGKVDGAFDRDQIATFEIDDRIVPMKDGPLDTVDEIRLVPGMTDELYDAVKDFFTVYPVTVDPDNPSVRSFSSEINLNAAPLEVVYALLRGTAAAGDRCESVAVNEEQAMKLANQFIQSNFPTAAAGTATAAPAAAAATNFNVQRDVGILPAPVTAMGVKKTGGGERFYRVAVTAFMPDGQEATITRVVRTNIGGAVQPLYYREE